MKLVRSALLAIISVSPSFALASEDLSSMVVPKLRAYCESCHGLGRLRFIKSDDDAVVWNDLFTTTSPMSQQPWAELIVKVLDWPSGTPYPAFDKPMGPGTKDWMPKGMSRVELSEDFTGDTPTRLFLLEEIKRELLTRPRP